jgi:hypothetical protein
MSSNLLYIIESIAICTKFIFVAIVLHTPDASSTVLTMAFNHLPSSDTKEYLKTVFWFKAAF